MLHVYPWHKSFGGIDTFQKGTMLTVSGRISELNYYSLKLSSPELLRMTPLTTQEKA